MQEAIGKPAGGSADIEAVEASDLDLKMRQRCIDLLSSARNETRRLIDGQERILGKRL